MRCVTEDTSRVPTNRFGKYGLELEKDLKRTGKRYMKKHGLLPGQFGAFVTSLTTLLETQNQGCAFYKCTVGCEHYQFCGREVRQAPARVACQATSQKTFDRIFGMCGANCQHRVAGSGELVGADEAGGECRNDICEKECQVAKEDV